MEKNDVSRATIFRWSGLAAMLAGLFYIIESSMELLHKQGDRFVTTADKLIEIFFMGALFLTLIALFGLRKATGKGVFQTVSYSVISLGTLTMLSIATASLLNGGNVLGIIFLVGALLALPGSILFGIALIRGGMLPFWCGLALMISLPLSMIIPLVNENLDGGILLGLAWVVIGSTLMTKVSKKMLNPQPG